MLGPDPITLPTGPLAPTAAAPRALIERQMTKLERLAEMGMEIAEAAVQRARALAEGEDTDTSATDPGLSFARAARAVRLTIALQSRLAEALAALDRGEAVARVGEAARRRGRIQRLVEGAAESEGCDASEIERLSSEVWERLTDADESDLLDGPIEQVVARICLDLGLPFDGRDWAGAHPSSSGQVERKPFAPAAPDARRGASKRQDDHPPSEAPTADSRLQREQTENRNEPGTAMSERVRQ